MSPYNCSQSLFSSSSLEMVPLARHVARLERFAIKGDVPSDALTNMTASLAFVKDAVLMAIPALDDCKDSGLAVGKGSSLHETNSFALPQPR